MKYEEREEWIRKKNEKERFGYRKIEDYEERGEEGWMILLCWFVWKELLNIIKKL